LLLLNDLPDAELLTLLNDLVSARELGLPFRN
jgi:hypothetical protein